MVAIRKIIASRKGDQIMDAISLPGAFSSNFSTVGIVPDTDLRNPHHDLTQDRIEPGLRSSSPSLLDVFQSQGLSDQKPSPNLDAGSALVAMAFPPTLGQGEANDIVSDAVNHSLMQGHGKVDLQSVKTAVNKEFGRRDAGSMNLELHPEPTSGDPSRAVLRSRDSLIRIYESSTHGGRGDGGVRIEIRPGGRDQRNMIEQRMRYDSRTQAVMRSLPEWNSKEVPYVPTRIRNGDDARTSE